MKADGRACTDSKSHSFRESRGSNPQPKTSQQRPSEDESQAHDTSTQVQISSRCCCVPFFSCVKFGRRRTSRSASTVLSAVEVFLFPSNGANIAVTPSPPVPPMQRCKRLRLKHQENRITSEEARAIGPASPEADENGSQEFLPGWRKIIDDRTGHVYYHHEASGKSLWEVPIWKELTEQKQESEGVEIEQAKATIKVDPVKRKKELAVQDDSHRDSVDDGTSREVLPSTEVTVSVQVEEDFARDRRRSRSTSPKFSYVKEISQFYGRNAYDG